MLYFLNLLKCLSSGVRRVRGFANSAIRSASNHSATGVDLKGILVMPP
jgi:hypothetical protein